MSKEKIPTHCIFMCGSVRLCLTWSVCRQHRQCPSISCGTLHAYIGNCIRQAVGKYTHWMRPGRRSENAREPGEMARFEKERKFGSLYFIIILFLLRWSAHFCTCIHGAQRKQRSNCEFVSREPDKKIEKSERNEVVDKRAYTYKYIYIYTCTNWIDKQCASGYSI